MKVVLLGATGKVGAPVREELLARGHDVTAVVRDATRLPAETAAFRHRPGDVFDDAFLTDALAGAQVVVCSVALRDAAQRGRIPVELIRGVARVSAAIGARLVALGGAGSLRTATGEDLVDTAGFPAAARPESLGFREALHGLIDDAPPELVWTVVSPPMSIEVDGPRTGSYRVADDTLITDDRGDSRISAADLAVAVVDEVESPRHPRRRFTVGY
ncbi:NAD(P)-dependent oxidoreductase [Streptosporangium sp. CA-115845]|uniref:NAD(P)-dependent oxidoreductase n=1 Tax=Streptosporangium sp. CA-115845 TaxID=3240071 RepID=UPI003D939FA1